MSRTRKEIEQWLVEQVATRLQLPPENVSKDEPLVASGLDSAAALELSGDIETWLDVHVPTTLFWDRPTIPEIAEYLAETMGTPSEGTSPAKMSEGTMLTKTSDETVLTKLRSFVEERFLLDEGMLTNDLDLFDAGIVDSFGLIEIVAFLESNWAVILEEKEFMSVQMATVGGIASLVAEKQAAQ